MTATTADTSADTATADGWIGYLATHPDQVAVLIDDGRGAAVTHRTAEAQPAASAGKIIHLAAYAQAVDAGTLDPRQPVTIGEWEQWYLPGLDGGAHPAALAELGVALDPTGRFAADPATTVTIDDVAGAMIKVSDNAAADLLRDRLGDDALRAVVDAAGSTPTAAGDPETGSAGTGSAGTGSAGTGSAGAGSAGTGSAGTGSAGTGSVGAGSAGTSSAGAGSAGTGSAGAEPSPAAELPSFLGAQIALLEGRPSGDSVAELTAAQQFSRDPAVRDRARALTAPPLDVQLDWADGTATVTAGGLAQVATALSAAADDPDRPGAQLARRHLEWPPVPAGALGLGAKGGSLPGLLTETFVLRRSDGTVGTAVLMARGMDAAAWTTAIESFAHQELLLAALEDPDTLGRLDCALPAS